MLRNKRTVLLLFLSSFLIWQIADSSGEDGFVTETIIPSAAIGTCSPLIKGRPFSVCCKTSFLGNASIRMYAPDRVFHIDGAQNGLVLLMTCQAKTLLGEITVLCEKTDIDSLHAVVFPTFDPALHLGNWKCENYAVSSNVTLTSKEVVTRSDGMILGEETQSANFRWNMTITSQHADYLVISPTGDVIVNVSGDVPYIQSNRVEFIGEIMKGKMWTRLNNVTRSDAGMYVCQSSQGVKASVTLIVKEKPTKPRIIYRNVHIDGNSQRLSAALYCWSESASKGPMMYQQRITYKWASLSSSSGPKIELNGSGVNSWNVPCNVITSYPMSCRAEQYGLVSESTWIAPQSLCALTGSIIPEGSVHDSATNPPVDRVSVAVSVTFSAIFLLVFLFNFWYIYKRRGGSSSQIFPWLCHSRCCLATQNGFRSGFASFTGCLSCIVTFIRHCHRRNRERTYQDADNSRGVGFDGVIVHDHVEQQDLAVRHQNNGNEQAAVATQQIPGQGTSNLPRGRPESGAAGGALISASWNEDEIRMHYEFEARTNLNILHGMLKDPPHMLRVMRNDLVTDVMSKFKDSSVAEQKISTRFIDEDGADLGGVTKDMFTSFWSKAREMYFPGNEAFIPYLDLASRSKQRDFITLGRIFSHSTATLKSLPIQICRSTLMVMIYDTWDINPDTLLQDFLLYVDGEYQELIRCSLNNFVDLGEDEKDRLQKFFEKYGMGIDPKAVTIREHLINLAQNELCIKPKIFCENMRKGIPQGHMEHFWINITLEHLEHLYKVFLVTPENVWSKIRCEKWPQLNPSEICVFSYLSDLIQDLHGENLLSFLQFVTAERKIPTSFIILGFNDTQGIARRPIASTCACRLDIPVSYSSFDEFKAEFMMVLNSDEAQTFTIH